MTGASMTDAQAPAGVAFPLAGGSRSTTATGTAVFAAAARVLDEDIARGIEREDDWRHRYIHHLRRITEAELAAPDGSARVPEVAISALHDRMVFVADGEELPLETALASNLGDDLETVTVEGRGAADDELVVPYRGHHLVADDLRRQLDDWVDRGIAEPSFAAAIRQVLAHPEWLDLRGTSFALLGAGAELGPLAQLSRWGARIAAVDIPRPRVWERILTLAAEGAGSVDVPVRRSSVGDSELPTVAGADLTTETPAIARWLERLEGPLVLGNYVYADGADNVRVSVAVDAIIRRLATTDDLSLAVLATPTDVYAVPREAAEASRRHYEQRSMLARGMAGVSAGKLFAPNYRASASTGQPMNVADAQVPQQGPNYALAKHLHRWRARQARSSGSISSINVAPPTRTRSVTKNRLLAAAYRGAPRFDVEVFEPDTANTLMAAMLVHDLRHPGASSRPDAALSHPLEQLTWGANHGGLWRIPYAPRSVLGLAAAGGFVGLGT